jgi:hypothetical protein
VIAANDYHLKSREPRGRQVEEPEKPAHRRYWRIGDVIYVPRDEQHIHSLRFEAIKQPLEEKIVLRFAD